MTKKKRPEELLPNRRPSTYSPHLAKLICDLTASCTMGIKKLCNHHPEIPSYETIFRWRWEYPEFREQYAAAKAAQAELLAEETLDIADSAEEDVRLNERGEPTINNEFVQRSKLRIDTRKWHASKLMPYKYGDKDEKQEEAIDSIKQDLLELRTRLNEKKSAPY